MDLASLLVPTYTEMLKALSGWLSKAEAQIGEDAQALLTARLAPDMYPLSTQVRFACVQALDGVFRLMGKPFPSSHADLIEEGRDAGERPGTIADAQARITETLALLEGLSLSELDGASDRMIAHEIPNGMVFDLTAEQYARDWAMGQFYFHLMIAYAILRHQGLELGKADYIPHMLNFLRPGTLPRG